MQAQVRASCMAPQLRASSLHRHVWLHKNRDITQQGLGAVHETGQCTGLSAAGTVFLLDGVTLVCLCLGAPTPLAGCCIRVRHVACIFAFGQDLWGIHVQSRQPTDWCMDAGKVISRKRVDARFIHDAVGGEHGDHPPNGTPQLCSDHWNGCTHIHQTLKPAGKPAQIYRPTLTERCCALMSL